MQEFGVRWRQFCFQKCFDRVLNEMPPVNLNSLWVRQRIAVNYSVVMAYQGSWWIKGHANETLSDNAKWNQWSLRDFFRTELGKHLFSSLPIIRITKLFWRCINLQRSCSSAQILGEVVMRDHLGECKKGEELFLFMIDFTFMHSIAMLIFSKYIHTYYLLQSPYNLLK